MRGGLVALAACLLLAACSDGASGGDALNVPDPAEHTAFVPEAKCAPCHPQQVADYAPSPMRYAAFSPVFNAFELALEQTSGGALSRHAQSPERANFCAGCHAPVGAYQDQKADGERLLRDILGHPTDGGVTCDFCHRAEGSPAPGAGLAAVPGVTKFGPIVDPIPNPFHRSEGSATFESSQLCGGCHDVRFPGEDVVTQQPFGRIEDLFTEWQNSPWANPDDPQNPMRGQTGITGLHDGREPQGETVSCQDCHMSLYPQRGLRDTVELEAFAGVDPNSLTRKTHKLYAIGQAAAGDTKDAPLRRLSNHRFVGASNPMVPFPMDPELDPLDALTPLPPAVYAVDAPTDADLLAAREVAEAFSRTGLEAGTRGPFQHREALLQAAATLDVEVQPKVGGLDVAVWVENVGAGHNIPAGFSQEREVWIELLVHDLGRACSDDSMCADLVEDRLFSDDPPGDCRVPDPTFEGDGLWRTKARKERSGVCDTQLERCILYRSGYLLDLDGDGRLHDEPLRHEISRLDSERFTEACVLEGPDRDWRVNGLDRGLALFTNQLQWVETDDDGMPVPETQARHLMPMGDRPTPSTTTPVLDQPTAQRRSPYYSQAARYEQVRFRAAPRPGPTGPRRGLGLSTVNPLQANRFFNGAALRPFEPRVARYGLLLPSATQGPLSVSARLRFRFMPPKVLRALAARHAEDQLVTEAMIDRYLRIIDMATWSGTVMMQP